MAGRQYLRGLLASLLPAFLAAVLAVSFPALSGAAPGPKRVVRIGAFNYYPGIFKDKDGAVKGFYVDALQEIGRRENIEFEYVYGTWSEGLERIRDGRVDVLTSVAFTPERAAFMDYTRVPLLTVWGELYVPTSSEIDSIRDVSGKRIAVMKDDVNARHFIELVGKFGIRCTFVELPGFEEVFRATAEKKVDAGVVNCTFGVPKQKEYGLRSTGVIFNPFDIYFTVAKGRNRQLLALLDNYLASWRNQENSVYTKARQKWSHGTVMTQNVIPGWIINSAVVVAILGLSTVVFIVALRRQVQSATEKLHLSEARNRILVQTIPDLVWAKDRHGRYVSCNPSFSSYCNAGEEDILGRTDYDLFDKALAETFRHHDRTAMESDDLVASEESLPCGKSGLHYLFETIRTPMHDSKGAIIGVMGVARNITDRKRAEEEREILQQQLYHSQKMEDIGRLIGGIAHDFNNFLTAIIGYSQVILARIPPDSELRHFAEMVNSAGEKAAALTRSLLTFSRKEAPDVRPVDIQEIITRVSDLLRRIIGEDIELVMEKSDQPLVVNADSGQMEQVLMNLVTNARDAMPGGGTISIKTECMTLDSQFASLHGWEEPGDHAVITVSDTGIGIMAEDMERIFEPFYTSKEPGKGTGLGLSIVRRIIQQHRGHIRLESAVGSGTCFTIYLPLHARERAANFPVQRNELPGGNETVLVCEDDASVRQLIRLLLENAGYAVLEAVDGQDAIEVFEQNQERIQLVILDMIMPKINGVAVLRHIRKLDPARRVLFVSGYAPEKINCGGVFDVNLPLIQKPILPRAFLRKVREALDA